MGSFPFGRPVITAHVIHAISFNRMNCMNQAKKLLFLSFELLLQCGGFLIES
jgi:hypothetical protein